MRTSSRTLAVLLFDEVEILDFAGALQMATMAGRHWNWRPFRILTCASKVGLIETCNQLKVEAQLSLDACPPAEILLIPGGYGARLAARDTTTVDWCRKQAQTAERILVVGAGAAIAASAGLLSETNIAVTEERLTWLKELIPESQLVTKEAVVDDGKVLSAAHGAASSELGMRLIEHCLGKSSAARVRAQFAMDSRSETLSVEVELPEILRPT